MADTSTREITRWLQRGAHLRARGAHGDGGHYGTRAGDFRQLVTVEPVDTGQDGAASSFELQCSDGSAFEVTVTRKKA